MKKTLLLFFTIFSLHLFAQQTTGITPDVVADDFMRTDPIIYTNNTSGTFVSSVLYGDVDQNNFDLLNANLRFTDKDQVLKLTFAPFKMLNNPSSKLADKKNGWIFQSLSDNIRLNASQSSSISTLGVSIGIDNSGFNSPNAIKASKRFHDSVPDAYKGPQDDARFKEYQKRLDDARIRYLKDRNRCVWKLSAGHNTQFFPTFSSSKTDSAGNEKRDSLNYYLLKANIFSFSGSVSLWDNRVSVSAGYFISDSRQSGVKDQKQIPYSGFSAGVNFRVAKLITEERLERNKDYIKTRFIPSVYIGGTYESQATTVGRIDYTYVDKGVLSTSAFTPNIDFCISPASQFRIGFPIIMTKNVDGSKGTDLGTMLQYTFKITNLAD